MPKEKQTSIYTKYEISRIIGARALQISMNAPVLLAFNKQELENMNYDPLKIAEKEFRSGVLPITVKRPLPQPIHEEEEDEIEVPVEEQPEAEEDQIAEMTPEKEEEKA